MYRSFLCLIIGLSLMTGAFAQNPFITHIYSADPSGHVWANDSTTLWIYASHDVPGTNHHATMFDYHVFSTTDLVNWTDHGRVLSVDDVDWAIDYAWAIDAINWQGKYYLIFCMHEKATGIFRTGIAESDVPQGPFKNLGFIKGIEWGQDPAVFNDDDNRVYIYWGSGGTCFAAELNSDLMSIKPDTKVELTSQLTNVFEGPWVHKYQGKYYLSYPGLTNGQWPEEMYYAISEKPLGPYAFKGKYIPEFKGQAGTNHGSIVKFKGKWIALHHSAILSGGKSEVRSLMGDYLYYNADGTIQPIVPNPAGLSQGKPVTSTVFLEAEDAPMAGGKLMETKMANDFQGFSGKGYVTNFLNHYNYLQVLVQVANGMKAKMIIRLSADADFSADILVGNLMRDGWNGTKIKKTNGWEEIDLGEVSLKEGDNLIRINSHQDVNLKVDYVKLIMP